MCTKHAIKVHSIFFTISLFLTFCFEVGFGRFSWPMIESLVLSNNHRLENIEVKNCEFYYKVIEEFTAISYKGM